MRITLFALLVAMVFALTACEKDIHEARTPGHGAVVASAR
jgi:hypothetical protein